MAERTSSIATALAVTGCGVVSPIGIGFEAFMEAFDDGRSGQVALGDYFAEPLPQKTACYLASFEVRDFLGRKGTSFYDRLTALGMVACDLTLAHSDLVITDANREMVGVIVGTSTGSLKSASDYSRETMTQEHPHWVNPILFPNTILNSLAGQAAIRYGLKGVNATVAGGQLSSLMVLRYASMVIRQGRANALVVGGVEEFTPHNAWRLHHTGLLEGTNTLMGEGSAMFVVEATTAVRKAGRFPLAEILACEVIQCGQLDEPEGLAQHFAGCISRALDRAGVTPEQIWAVSSSETGNCLLDTIERGGLNLALPQPLAHQLRVKRQVGECDSAAGAFQLAALLALYRKCTDGNRRCSLVLSVGEDGSMGCAVVKGGG